MLSTTRKTASCERKHEFANNDKKNVDTQVNERAHLEACSRFPAGIGCRVSVTYRPERKISLSKSRYYRTPDASALSVARTSGMRDDSEQ